MEKLVETLGITRLSKSQVSVMAKELEAVESFRSRRYLGLDILARSRPTGADNADPDKALPAASEAISA